MVFFVTLTNILNPFLNTSTIYFISTIFLLSNFVAILSSFPVYQTEEGKTKLNMFFKSSEKIQLTKVRIRVASGSRGPRRGFIFVFSHDK